MDRNDALIDITFEVTKICDGKMTESARRAIKEVYALTMEPFAKKGEREKVYVWESKRFRAFIIGQVRKIARAAVKLAGGKRVSGKHLHEAAVKVMTKTQEYCDTAIKDGKLHVAHPQVRKQGDVCTNYLATQA